VTQDPSVEALQRSSAVRNGTRREMSGTSACALPRPAPGSQHRRSREALLELADILEPTCRQLRAGDLVYHAGDRCAALHVLDAGLVRLRAADGVACGFRFRGDWLGIESLPSGWHDTTAQAMEASIVWSLRIESLAAASLVEPALVRSLVEAMGWRILRPAPGCGPMLRTRSE